MCLLVDHFLHLSDTVQMSRGTNYYTHHLHNKCFALIAYGVVFILAYTMDPCDCAIKVLLSNHNYLSCPCGVESGQAKWWTIHIIKCYFCRLSGVVQSVTYNVAGAVFIRNRVMILLIPTTICHSKPDEKGVNDVNKYRIYEYMNKRGKSWVNRKLYLERGALLPIGCLVNLKIRKAG